MKYFTISELTKSTTAKMYGIDNQPSPEVVDNLEVLINECLDNIRELWNRPIFINSGYRCKELNDKVKGSKTSDHLKGMAADITVGSKEANERLFNLILKSGIKFTQLINESDYTWIHISYNKNNLKTQVLKIN